MVVVSGTVTRTQTLVASASLTTSATTKALGGAIVSAGGSGGANSTDSAGGGPAPFEGAAVRLSGGVCLVVMGVLGVVFTL